MHALRLDPTQRSFGDFYEPRQGPRLSRRTLMVIGITTACYGVLGFYVMNQRYGIAEFRDPGEPPTIVVQPWLPPIPTRTPEKEKTVAARRAQDTPTKTAPTLPVTPTDEPVTDVRPDTTTRTAEPPVGPTTPADPGPTVAAPPGVIRNPVWISRPNAFQMAKVYPERATERGIAGRATLLCGIRANGTMAACEVLEETPGGWQFGEAALSLARHFRISPKTVDGLRVEGSKVRIPIVFSLDN